LLFLAKARIIIIVLARNSKLIKLFVMQTAVLRLHSKRWVFKVGNFSNKLAAKIVMVYLTC